MVVLLIGVLAKTKNYYIAGLIPLFPTHALIPQHATEPTKAAGKRIIPVKY
ncbi:GlpM family protein, partial [Escherichia sp. SS-MK2]